MSSLTVGSSSMAVTVEDFFATPKASDKPDMAIASESEVSKISKAMDDRGYALIGSAGVDYGFGFYEGDTFDPDGVCKVPAGLKSSYDELRQTFNKLQPEEGADSSFIRGRGSQSFTVFYDGNGGFKLSESSDSPINREIAKNTFLQELVKTSLRMMPHSSGLPGDQYRAKLGIGLCCHTETTTDDLLLHKDPGSYLFTYTIERSGMEGGDVRIALPGQSDPVVEKALEHPLEGYAIHQNEPVQDCIRHGAKKITKADTQVKVDVQDDGSVKLDVVPPTRKIVVIQVLG